MRQRLEQLEQQNFEFRKGSCVEERFFLGVNNNELINYHNYKTKITTTRKKNFNDPERTEIISHSSIWEFKYVSNFIHKEMIVEIEAFNQSNKN